MNWSADFQIGALEKPGMIAPIWKSALRCAFEGSKREIFRGNPFPPGGPPRANGYGVAMAVAASRHTPSLVLRT